MTYNVLEKPDVFYIGKQDENSAETIDIDYSAWIERYGEGVITATFQGAEDENPYDIVLTTANGIATWTVTDANTVAAGVGKLQLNYVVDEVVAKSLIWTVRVYPSMRASGEAPDGYQDWLTALQGLSAETQQNAQDAAQSATNAETYAEQAREAASSITGLTVEAETLPAGSSATASFDADTDKLSLGIPRGDKGEKGDDGQDGITPDLTIGTTETLPAGSSATATITGTTENPVLNLGIPQGIQGIQGERGVKGDTGATPDISIGTVETLNPDESATAAITGTAENPVLNFGIPKGDTGAAGEDGFSPSVSVTKQGGDIVITITDKDGTTSATLEVDDVLDDTSTNPVENQAIQNAIWNMLPVDTASGSIASFPDGADDVPMLSLKAQIEPVQDLHGYDSPWPAGGGKNLCSLSDVTFVQYVEKEITPIPSGTYIFSALVTSSDTDASACAVIFLDAEKNTITAKSIGRSTSSTDRHATSSFTASTAIQYIRFYASSGFPSGAGDTATFSDMQIESGSTATDFAPYENICPISGHTGAQVQKRGKNLLFTQDVTKRGNQYFVGADSQNIYPFKLKAGTYTFSYDGKGSYCYWQLKGTSINNVISSGVNKYGTFTLPQDGEYRFWFYQTVEASFYNIQLELGSTATDYEPFEGETIPVSWETEAGTVYGGTLDVVTGKLMVDRAMVDLGTLTWARASTYESGSYRFKATVDGIKLVSSPSMVGNIVCSSYPTQSANNTYLVQVGVAVETNGQISVFDAEAKQYTSDQFKAAMSGVQLVYELAEPIEYTLTAQEVRTFLGQNNIWADTGNTSVTYRADIQKFIEKKVNA